MYGNRVGPGKRLVGGKGWGQERDWLEGKGGAREGTSEKGWGYGNEKG